MSKLFWILTVSTCGQFYKPISASLQLDLNDILRIDLMPTTFLMFDGGVNDGKSIDAEKLSARLGEDDLGEYTLPFVPSKMSSGSNSSAALPMTSSPSSLTTDGNYMNALSTMRFHRWVPKIVYII